jgi:site-specific recombinase XerD
MLSDFITSGQGRSRYLATPFGEFLDGFIAHRRSQGFASETTRAALLHVTAFGEYLTGRGIDSFSGIDESKLEAFVESYRSAPRRSGMKRRTPKGSVSLVESLRGDLRNLLAYLRGIGIVSPVTRAKIPGEELVEDYLSFLQIHRGFARETLDLYRRWSMVFVRALARRSPPVEISAALSPTDVQAVVVDIAGRLGRRGRQILTTTVESFLRHLRGTGVIPKSCLPFLPRLKTHALASLPSCIEAEDIERTLQQVDRSSALGRRNYALLVLVATYGLRAGEVIGLRLERLHWRRGAIVVRQTKTRRDLELPMVPRVQEALVDYLRHGRPATEDRHVFQKVHAPRGPISRAILYDVVRKALLRAGVVAPQYGPHILRHSKATFLIRSGHPLKVAGDLLGHRVPEATLIYCKLAIEDLREVALELPEVSS